MKLLLRYLPAFTCIGLMLISCNDAVVTNADDIASRTPDSASLTKETINSRDSISLNPTLFDTLFIGYFSQFPPEIDGCSVLYSSDQSHIDASQYIYMNNYDSVSFMKIKGELVRFTLTKSEQPEQNTRTLQFTSEAYQLIIEEAYGERIGDEVWSNYGTLILTDQNGNKTTIRFVGESGC